MLSKKSKLAATVLIISAVVFSIVVFLIPFKKGTIFWIAYAAELIALLSQIPLFWATYRSSRDLKSRILSFPITQVGYLYLSVQSLASIILIVLGALIDDFPIWLTLIICIFIISFAAACCISVEIARDTVMKIEHETVVNTGFITAMRFKLENLVNRTQTSALKKELEKITEAFRYSDPVSSNATASKEEELI